MKKTGFIYLVLLILLSACAPKKQLLTRANTTANAGAAGDGSSFEKAIIITETGERKGIDAEYSWLREHYPGYKLQGQSLVHHEKKPFDIIKIVTAKGEAKSVYFNIENFFGKF